MNLFRYLCFFGALMMASCQQKDNSLPVIPKPQSVVIKSGYFKASDHLKVSISDTALKKVSEIFTGQAGTLFNISVMQDQKADIDLRLDKSGNSDEGYQLYVSGKKITIIGKTSNGVFNGLQTLRQLMLFGKQANGIKIHCCEITDAPRYAWRGFMVDESRHFFGKEKIKQLLDIMALQKLNTLHWHLTDEPGWRIEIKKYPDLTLIGGKGNYHDPQADPAYYTQEDIQEIVQFASARFIKIIPEVDMPGHAAAANKAYPEFCGGGSARYPNFTFNPGKEGTYGYLTSILREIIDLIPTSYIHTGGDEVYFGNEQWNTNQDVQKLMKKEKLKDLKEVESYFNHRMADSIKSLNKKLAGWDEIVDSEMDPENSIVMWWRHDKTGQLLKAFEKNYKVILCPRIPLYFDFVQDKSHQWGRKSRGAGCTIENVYNFPPDTLPGLKENSVKVLGIQANLWTEVIQNNDRFDFMTYPRISALAEAAWTQASQKNYAGFIPRLRKMLTYYDELKIRYYNPFDTARTQEPAGVRRPEAKAVTGQVIKK